MHKNCKNCLYWDKIDKDTYNLQKGDDLGTCDHENAPEFVLLEKFEGITNQDHKPLFAGGFCCNNFEKA